jgi:large subunit ribosomal protein L3
MKITGKKMKMSQIFEKNKVTPVTPVLVLGEDIPSFEKGEILRIKGVSKGKGFQGVVKRHGFAGGPKSHGQKDKLRAPGSIGAGGVQRVIKGLRMAGRMGGDRITLKKIKVVAYEPLNKIVFLGGSLPGNNGSKIEMHKKHNPNSANKDPNNTNNEAKTPHTT